MAIEFDSPALNQPPDVPSSSIDEIASPEEIAGAIEALTDAELKKLERYARFRVRGVGAAAAGRDHEDLLREAMAMTLGGQRRWRSHAVGLVPHLLGVMRSLSSHWAERGSREDIALDETRERAADSSTPDEVVSARQLLRQIETRFLTDAAVTSLLQGFREGMTGPEIQESFGLSRKNYDAAIKRLRRAVTKMAV